MRRKLSGSGFQVVYDINGREAVEAEPLLDSLAGRGGSLEQYIYCSSAGAWARARHARLPRRVLVGLLLPHGRLGVRFERQVGAVSRRWTRWRATAAGRRGPAAQQRRAGSGSGSRSSRSSSICRCLQ